MLEQENVDPRLLTPEHWDGHEIGDGCQPTQRPEIPYALLPISTARRVISNADLSAPRQLEEGFDASDAEDGLVTVVHFTGEGLSLDRGRGTKRHEFERWGTPVEFPERSGEKVIVLFTTFWSDGSGLVPAFPQLSLRQGVVMHKRMSTGFRGKESEWLERINNIEVYVFGGEGGKKVRAPRPSKAPRAGLVFRPLPGMA